MTYDRSARHYFFNLDPWVSPSTFDITDFDGDGQWELTYTLFDRDGLGANEHPIVILEFRDIAPTTPATWIAEPEGSLVNITAEIFADDPNGIPGIDFGRQMIVADINGDGFDDLVVANHGFDRDPFPGGTNIIALSDGTGGLIDIATRFEPEPQFTHSMAVGDFDADGRADFFFGNLNVDEAYFATLDGMGALMDSFPLVPEPNRYTRSYATDLDGDGKDELLLGGDGGVVDRLARWNGSSWHVVILPTTATHTTLDFRSGDVNDDGLTDIMVLSTVGNYRGIALDLLLGTSTGGYVNASDTWIDAQLDPLPADAWATDVGLADLDGDGDLDLTLSVQFPYNDRVFWNTGTGFELSDTPTVDIWGNPSKAAWGQGSDATSLLAKDLDGDGVAEVIALELGLVSVYHYNQPVELGTADNDTMDGGAWASDIMHGGGGDDLLRGWNGHDLLRGDVGNDTLDGWRDDDTLYGGSGADSLIAGDGNDVAYGGAGNDTIEATETWDAAPSPTSGSNLFFGGTGDDILWGGYGDDALLGGAGQDRLSGEGGNDTLYGDGLDFRSTQDAARVFRLYQATLDRAPDAVGYASWTERLAFGQIDLLETARGFVASPEFTRVYGALSDGAFVTQLYNNVLDRAPDDAGLAFWTDRIASGMSREQALLGFSESPEFITKTNAAATGYAAASMEASWTDDVYRLYRATLDREPDAAGYKGWIGKLVAGADYLTVAQGFVLSQEFQNTYGALDSTTFVTLLYRNVMNRAPDAAGLSSWVERLDSGAMDQTQVLRGFAQSPEFTAATKTALAAYVRGFGTDDVLTLRTETWDGPEAWSHSVLYGGAYSDRFEIQMGYATIGDLEPWDIIALPRIWHDNAPVSASDALGMLRQDGDDVLLDWQEVMEGQVVNDWARLRFLDTQVADITVDNFEFI